MRKTVLNGKSLVEFCSYFYLTAIWNGILVQNIGTDNESLESISKWIVN